MDPVEVVTLGGTALRVTRLGLGTVPLGGFPASMTDADAERLVSRASPPGFACSTPRRSTVTGPPSDGSGPRSGAVLGSPLCLAPK